VDGKRVLITAEQVKEAVALVTEKLIARLNQKGWHSYASIHECSGVIDEEFDELKEAVQLNDHDQFEKEMMDIAVGCIFSIACKRAKALDW